MNQINPTPSVYDDRIDFLDLLVAAAESWKLIVIGTLLVAVATAMILFLIPPVYESFSALPLSPRLRAAMNSAVVLDPVINENKLAAKTGGDIETARESLRRKIRVEELVKDSGFYRIGIQGDTPAQAKELATSYLTQVLLQSKPVGTEAQKIQEKMAVARDTIAELQKLSERLGPDSNNQLMGASGPGKTEDDRFTRRLLIPIEIERRRSDIVGLEHDLDGLKIVDVLEQPNLPATPIAQHRLSHFLAVTGAGFLALIFFANVRDANRKMDKNSERARKITRIREALSWRRQNGVESA